MQGPGEISDFEYISYIVSPYMEGLLLWARIVSSVIRNNHQTLMQAHFRSLETLVVPSRWFWIMYVPEPPGNWAWQNAPSCSQLSTSRLSITLRADLQRVRSAAGGQAGQNPMWHARRLNEPCSSSRSSIKALQKPYSRCSKLRRLCFSGQVQEHRAAI